MCSAEGVYEAPVLLFSLASLVQSKAKMNIIYECHKNTLTRLMKLHDKTPDCVVFFLAGSLPVLALLHLRQLSLFNMICHLEGNILQVLAKEALVSAKVSARSWFHDIRNLCVQYELPHPLKLLENPFPKNLFKKLCKEKVTEFWHYKLSSKVASLSSLTYLQPRYLSLCSPHPMWTSLDDNPYQARAACIQALFLSGRYRTERMCRFWSKNKDGICLLPSCKNIFVSETIQHVLLHCSGMNENRRRLKSFTDKIAVDKPVIQQIISTYMNTDDEYLRVQFLLDCSVLPLVISSYQIHGPIIYQQLYRISRTWCRSLHLARLKLLGRYNKL